MPSTQQYLAPHIATARLDRCPVDATGMYRCQVHRQGAQALCEYTGQLCLTAMLEWNMVREETRTPSRSVLHNRVPENSQFNLGYEPSGHHEWRVGPPL